MSETIKAYCPNCKKINIFTAKKRHIEEGARNTCDFCGEMFDLHKWKKEQIESKWLGNVTDD